MKLTELLSQLNLGNLSILLFLVLSLVEISPIKINPWSMLIKWFARLLGISDLKTEIVRVTILCLAIMTTFLCTLYGTNQFVLVSTLYSLP